MPPDSAVLNRRSEASGWSCSKRPPRASPGSPLSSTPKLLQLPRKCCDRTCSTDALSTGGVLPRDRRACAPDRRFAAEPNGGLLMLPPPLIPDRATILKVAAQHRLPAIYPNRALAAEGGLISYNSDLVDQHRRAASYVDRILRGASVADLPVEFPTKYKLVVNLKTAKAIGLTIPETFLMHADELIE